MTSTTTTEQSQQPEVPAATTKETTEVQQQAASTENKEGAEVKANAESGDATATGDGEKKEGENKETTASPVKKPTVHKTDYEEGKVYLYQFERCTSLPSSSFHCLKLETFLRMANIPYENVDHKMRYRSSKGDMPFVELNGREIAEIDTIIEELSKEFNVDLDADLTEEQKVIAHALQSMLENHTGWIIKHWRFKHPQEFLKASGTDIKKTINSKLPQSVLNFMFKIGFKSNIKDLIGHGIGRHDADQVYATGRKDLQVLSKQLGDKEYFFGDKPHLLDAEAFSILAQFIYVPFENYDEFIKNETPNLFKFVERMKERYWKDWDTICQPGDSDSSPKKEGETDESKKAEEASEEEKKKKEELKKEKEEKKRKEKEEKERKKKEEKEEKERKKREAKEKAEKEKAEKEKAEKEKAEKEKAAAAEKEKTEKSGEEGKEEAKSSESQAKTGAEGGDKAEGEKAETKESDAKAGEA